MEDHLIEEMMHHARKVAYRKLGNYEDSEDVSQEVMLKVFAEGAIEGFRNRADIKTWIYRITLNACINLIRQRIRQELTTRKFIGLQALKTDEIREKAVLADILRRAAACLTPVERDVFEKRVVGEAGVKEIASTMKRSEKWVKNQLRSIRRKLTGPVLEFYRNPQTEWVVETESSQTAAAERSLKLTKRIVPNSF